jgi:hypothetical protein
MAGTITSAIATSAKLEIARALHNFTLSTGHAFKLALLKTEAAIATNYGAASTDYDNVGTDEVANGSGYTTGGIALTNITPQTSGTTSFWSFSNNPQWTAATFDTGGGVLYNTSQGNAIVAVFNWGGTKSITSGTFTVTWPTNDSTNAVLRIT